MCSAEWFISSMCGINQPTLGSHFGDSKQCAQRIFNDIRSTCRSCDVTHDVSSWLDRCTEQIGAHVV